jgi:iron uptake system component EfeO
MPSPRPAALVAAGALVLGGASACAGKDDPAAAGGPVSVSASESACKVSRTELPAGKHTFDVKNEGTKVTEFYVYAEGDRIVGEIENVGPGLSRKFIVELPAGKYEGACKPGMVGKGMRTRLTVTGDAAPHESTDQKLADATASYQKVVEAHSQSLIEKTRRFTDAVKAKDVDKAKSLFPVARYDWEFIEPVAESFGDLDPAIDAREADLEPGQQWTGFHKLEKDLWVTRDLSKSGPAADKLLVDVQKIVDESKSVTLNPLQLANGAKELLDEVATGKVTGEEDTFSHTDLWDFHANVEGSKASIAALRPVLQERDPALVKDLDARFAAVDAELAKHAQGDGFVTYDKLSKDEVKALSTVINAVGEPVSKVAAVVAKDKK